MRVYKFLPAKWALDAVRRGRLKVSLLNSLNDPYDLKPLRFDSAEDEVTWSQLVGAFSQISAVACFSKSWDDPVLWSHYADSHMGIVLEFELDVQPDTVFEVQYSDQLMPFSEWKHRKDKEESWVPMALSTKARSWSYENEVRIFVRLQSCFEDAGHFFISFGQSLDFKGLVLGANSLTLPEVPVLLHLLSAKNGLTCKKAGKSKDRFEIIEDKSWIHIGQNRTRS